MNNLFILTGLYKGLSNLPQLFGSIKTAIESLDKSQLDIWQFKWIIIIDRNSGYYYSDILNKFKVLNTYELDQKTTNLNVCITYGSSNTTEPHYGGDIFNHFLLHGVEDTSDRFSPGQDNDWVYILDDDNIMHPFLLQALSRCTDKLQDGHKDPWLIWTTCKLSTGMIRECNDAEAYLPDYNEWISSHRMMDPSQVLVRYKLLKAVGFYKSGHDYDFTTGKEIWSWLKSNFKDYCFYNFIDKGFGQDKWHTYWNGAVDLKKLKLWMDRLKNPNDTTAGELCLESWHYNRTDIRGEEPTISIPLTAEEQRLLLSVLISYREDLNYDRF